MNCSPIADRRRAEPAPSRLDQNPDAAPEAAVARCQDAQADDRRGIAQPNVN